MEGKLINGTTFMGKNLTFKWDKTYVFIFIFEFKEIVIYLGAFSLANMIINYLNYHSHISIGNYPGSFNLTTWIGRMDLTFVGSPDRIDDCFHDEISDTVQYYLRISLPERFYNK